MDSGINSGFVGVKSDLRYAAHAGYQELRNRFSASVLGGLWLFVGPLLLMFLYWVVFDLVVGIEFVNPTNGQEVPFLAPFSVGFFLYLAFSEILGGSADWFRSKRRLLTESHLAPWSIYAILLVRTGIQFVFYIAITIGVCSFYGLTSAYNSILYLIVCVPLFMLFGAVGLGVSILGAFFRDVKEFMPVLMRVIFYASSITFPISKIPDNLQWLPMANPLTWAVEICRNTLLWGGAVSWSYLGNLAALSAVVLFIALFLYWRLAKVLDQVT